MKKNENKKSGYTISIILFFSLLFVSSNCNPIVQYTYQQPENINDGLVVGSLEEVNIAESDLKKAIDKINRGRYGEVHSMLIFKDSKRVFEEYFPGHEYKWDGPNHHGEWVFWDKSMIIPQPIL